jgi:hypothetical protein
MSSVIMPNVTMQSVIILSAIMPRVIMPSVILSIVIMSSVIIRSVVMPTVMAHARVLLPPPRLELRLKKLKQPKPAEAATFKKSLFWQKKSNSGLQKC